MTWAKALPVLAIALIFDALRFLFEQFWFFGPALAAVYCTAKVNGVLTAWTTGLLGAKTAAAACGAGAAVAGYFGAPAFEAFGVVMAIAVGLFGWMTVGLILIITNSRIFKENEGHALWFVVSLLISETPIIGSIPGFTIITAKMYSTQIKKDKEALKKYNERQTAELMQARTAQMAQAEIY